MEIRGILLLGGGALLSEAVGNAAVRYVPFRRPVFRLCHPPGQLALGPRLGRVLAHERKQHFAGAEGLRHPVDDGLRVFQFSRQYQMPDENTASQLAVFHSVRPGLAEHL